MHDEMNNKCFVATPIGPKASDTRRSVDGILDEIIEPALREFDLELIVAHRIDDSGSISLSGTLYMSQLRTCWRWVYCGLARMQEIFSGFDFRF